MKPDRIIHPVNGIGPGVSPGARQLAEKHAHELRLRRKREIAQNISRLFRSKRHAS